MGRGKGGEDNNEDIAGEKREKAVFEGGGRGRDEKVNKWLSLFKEIGDLEMHLFSKKCLTRPRVTLCGDCVRLSMAWCGGGSGTRKKDEQTEPEFWCAKNTWSLVRPAKFEKKRFEKCAPKH